MIGCGPGHSAAADDEHADALAFMLAHMHERSRTHARTHACTHDRMHTLTAARTNAHAATELPKANVGGGAEAAHAQHCCLRPS